MLRHGLLAFLLMTCAACDAGPNSAPEGTVSEARTIGVLLFDKVLTSDVVAPLEVFGNAINQGRLEGWHVVTIAPEKRVIRTEEGVGLAPDHSIADAPELGALIVGSAYEMAPILDNQALVTFVKERGLRARWLASNCSGAQLLGEAGLLSGRKVTTYPGGEAILKARNLDADVEFGQRVVVDGGLVTSNGGLVSYEAALALLAAMTNAETAQASADDLYFTRLVEAIGGER